MKKVITSLFAAAMAALSFNALAGLVPLPGALDPGNPDTGIFGQQVCPKALGGGFDCPSNGGSISGEDIINFDIVNNDGIMNIGITGSVTPSTGGAFTFSYTVFNPAAIPISIGLPQLPPDFSVPIGTGYKIVLDWTLTATATGTPRSANFALVATTAPVVPTVPEPMTLALFGIGLAGLGFARRRKLS
jgi:hypothetical protein